MTAGLPFTSIQYAVDTPLYAGPLDLLLQLIERAELDITRLALAQVTDQYLSYLHNLTETASDEVSAFLVIAARLLQIKSEALLPRPPQREPGEEDPGDALARRLLIYKRFKQLAELLGGRETANWRVFTRQAPPLKIEAPLDLEGITVADLLAMAQWLLTQERPLPELGTVVPAPRVTIREKIALITEFLRKNSRGTLGQLLIDRRHRLDTVVTFLALLELVKRHMLSARQSALFAEIDFEPTESWSDDISFDLEFGE